MDRGLWVQTLTLVNRRLGTPRKWLGSQSYQPNDAARCALLRPIPTLPSFLHQSVDLKLSALSRLYQLFCKTRRIVVIPWWFGRFTIRARKPTTHQNTARRQRTVEQSKHARVAIRADECSRQAHYSSTTLRHHASPNPSPRHLPRISHICHRRPATEECGSRLQWRWLSDAA